MKLLFRFAAEVPPRESNQTERMWVRITDIEDDENYVGTLENDSRHSDVVACG